jgi:DtxR family transcriptional regulator, Mn-dependent transcriptional regulator
LNNNNKLSLTPKMKDYLTGISEIEDKKPVARVGEIAAVLGVKGPSAHTMVKMLASRKLVTYEKYGYITLTEKGRKIADQLRNKNNAIKNFFYKIFGG